MSLLLVGIAIFALPGLWAIPRARREMLRDGRIGWSTLVAVFIAYVGHAAVTLIAAWRGTWPLPFGPSLAGAVGGALLAIGAIIYLLARRQFRSIRLAWGLETTRLETSGIYRYSRNPQTLGVLCFLMGAALIGKSGVALILVGVAWIGSLLSLPVEEEFLERRFGDGYRRYRREVPRFFAWPKRG